MKPLMRVAYLAALRRGLLRAAVAPEGIFFPTVPRQDAYPSALIRGTLEERDGCLFVTSESERWLVLWPNGYRAQAENDRLEVVAGNGAVVGREGDQIRLVGGETRPIEVGGAAAAEGWASELTGLQVPERCDDVYWIVAPD
jgi:hypothetical protein